MIDIHWKEILEVVGRTCAVYIFIVGAIVLFGKKELAQLSIVDLVLILLISNSVQNAMVGPYTSLEAGITSAATLFALNAVMRRLVFKRSFISRLVEGEPVVLIKNGEIIQSAVTREKITLNELEAAIREHGIDCVDNVQMAMLETDGNISVVSYSDDDAHTSTFNVQNHRKNKKFRKRI